MLAVLLMLTPDVDRHLVLNVQFANKTRICASAAPALSAGMAHIAYVAIIVHPVMQREYDVHATVRRVGNHIVSYAHTVQYVERTRQLERVLGVALDAVTKSQLAYALAEIAKHAILIRVTVELCCRCSLNLESALPEVQRCRGN